MNADAGAAPPLGQRPNEPAPGKDSLANPQGRQEDGGERGTCPDCGLPFGEHPEYHAGSPGSPGQDGRTPEGELPGQRLDEPDLGGDPAED